MPDLDRIPDPPWLKEWRESGKIEADARCFRMGNCRVIVGSSDRGWHMSISHPNRYPNWDEIAKARYVLVPDHVLMVMLLPGQDDYVNLAQTTFHLWEAKRINFELLIHDDRDQDLQQV